MSGLSRIGVAIDSDLLEKFDRLIAQRGYSNRSEAFRDLIRDELVEILAGAYLGKMLWRHDGDRHTLLAYFALREPARS